MVAAAKEIAVRHPDRGQPRYFHLLWDEDLDELREVLEIIRDRRTEVASNWYQLYVLHFGDSRSLSETEFRSIFEPALLRNKSALLRKDMDGYARDVLRLGAELAERRVPLQEIIASLHLFEEAAQAVFPQDPPLPTAIYTKFDKLSHIRIILLVDSYSRSQWATAATRIHALELEAKHLPATQRTRFHGLVGKSAAMRELYQRIELAGQTREPVLIVGESGTGREQVARAIHECGLRPGAPFAALTCAALPQDLVEGELFGQARAGVDGEELEHLGLLRAAEGGSVFIEGLGELNPDTQAALDTAIAQERIVPVGAGDGIKVDVRLIASIGQIPENAVAGGHLRPDLYERMRNNVLFVPPLRERADDIPLLVQHFIDLFNERLMRPSAVTGIEKDALEAMARYSWPGNVREVREALESAFAVGTSPLIQIADLPQNISGFSEASERSRQVALGSFADAERDLMKRALEISAGDRSRAAKLLKISRKTLDSAIIKYGLE